MTWDDPIKLGSEGGDSWWAYHRARVGLWRDLMTTEDAHPGAYVPCASIRGDVQLLGLARNGTRKAGSTKSDPWQWWTGDGRVPWGPKHGIVVWAVVGVREAWVRRFAGRLRLVGEVEGGKVVGTASRWLVGAMTGAWAGLEIDAALDIYAGAPKNVGLTLRCGGSVGDLRGDLALLAMDALETFRPELDGYVDSLPVQWARYLARCVALRRANYVRTGQSFASLSEAPGVMDVVSIGRGVRGHAIVVNPRGHGLVIEGATPEPWATSVRRVLGGRVRHG